MIKKITFSILPVFLFFFFFAHLKVFSQEVKTLNLYFFYIDGCPHCAKEKIFLEKVVGKHKGVNIYRYEISINENNRDIFLQIGERLGVDVSGVPVTIVGDRSYIGYYNEETTGAEIEKRIQYCFSSACPDKTGEIISLSNIKESSAASRVSPDPSGLNNNSNGSENKIPKTIDFPFFGSIQTKNISLPVFTIILAGLDGFNPCAMWVLVFLISLLLGMQDKKRMWVLGGVFILSSAFVYFLFMAAWLNLVLLIGFIIWIRASIGIVALSGGVYNIREFFVNKNSACKVVGTEKKKITFGKLKNIIYEKRFLFALTGIIVTAAAVNLVELICSAGLPVIYTQVLAISSLSKLQYYLYLSLYIFIFMLDDLFVFFTAMITLQMTGITTKYVRISHLLSGAVMVIIGILLLFKPQLLMFG